MKPNRNIKLRSVQSSKATFHTSLTKTYTNRFLSWLRSSVYSSSSTLFDIIDRLIICNFSQFVNGPRSIINMIRKSLYYSHLKKRIDTPTQRITSTTIMIIGINTLLIGRPREVAFKILMPCVNGIILATFCIAVGMIS